MADLRWFCYDPQEAEIAWQNPSPCAIGGFVGSWISGQDLSARLQYAGEHSMDVFGNQDDIELSDSGEIGPYVAIYIVGPTVVRPISPMERAGLLGCEGDFACTVLIERGEPSHHMQFAEAFFVGAEPVEMVPFDIPLGNNRRTAVMYVGWNRSNFAGDPVMGSGDRPCWLTLNSKCLHDFEVNLWNDPFYHQAWNYLELVPTSNFGFNIEDSTFAPMFDKGLAWRRIYDKSLNVAVDNLPFLRIVNNQAPPDRRLAGRWLADRVWNCGESPIVPGAEGVQMRFIGRKTGVVVSHAALAVRRAFAQVELGLLYLNDSTTHDEQFFVPAEISIRAELGIVRSAHAVDYWAPRGALDSDGQQLYVPVDFGEDLCSETCIVTRPDGRTFTEELICQVRESDQDPWRGVPRFVTWKGLSAPAPWGYPAMVDRMPVVPPGWEEHNDGSAAAQCCDALYVVQSLSVPAEPTYERAAHQSERQKYRGALVLNLPDIANSTCGVES